jgi:hypothetical protein
MTVYAPNKFHKNNDYDTPSVYIFIIHMIGIR